MTLAHFRRGSIASPLSCLLAIAMAFAGVPPVAVAQLATTEDEALKEYEEARERFVEARERYRQILNGESEGSIEIARENYEEARKTYEETRDNYEDLGGDIDELDEVEIDESEPVRVNGGATVGDPNGEFRSDVKRLLIEGFIAAGLVTGTVVVGVTTAPIWLTALAVGAVGWAIWDIARTVGKWNTDIRNNKTGTRRVITRPKTTSPDPNTANVVPR